MRWRHHCAQVKLMAPKLIATTHILAIRHGETDWNRTRQYQGQEDTALNDKGLAQAREIAKSLTSTRLDALYTNDLKRAYQTAAETAQLLAILPKQVPGLREQHFGVFQGLTSDVVTQRWPEASAQWHRRDADFGPEGGETRNAFSRRCVSTLRELAQTHAGQTIAIVCHGGVLDCLYRAATGLPMDKPRTWPLANAAITRLSFDASGFTILSWGDTAHLSRDASDEMVEHVPGP